MSEYKKIEKEGWCIIPSDSNTFFLRIEAGIIGKMGAIYVVNKEIYNEVNNSSITLEQLINEYNILSDFKKLFDVSEEKKGFTIPNTDTRYGNGDFIVTNENGVYFIEYQLSGHGGGSRKFKITKEIYDEARTGKFSTSDLFKKHNLYHLDIPENNVK